MPHKHVFRPGDLARMDQLEPRDALSHFGITHLAVFNVQAASVHHMTAHHAAHGPGKLAHHRPGRNHSTGAGPTSQSSPTTPIVVLPISSPPVSSPPSSTAPTSGSSTTTIGIPSVSTVMTAQEQGIVDLVNQQRAQAGLGTLQVNTQLVEIAHIQSTDMAELGQMAHELPGAALPTLQSRAQYAGYSFLLLGENIAFNYPDDNSVMNAWMNSPEHRANILDPSYTQIGVGIAYDSQGEPYYTQEFGQPQ
jgi:uncharacterized protein YkwD